MFRPGTRFVLLVLEDCHWIDPPSMALLELLAHNLADQPVLVVAAARGELAGATPLAPLARLGHGTELPLETLPAPATEELATERLRASFGEGVRLPAEVVRGIADRAGGNPFHLEELVAFLHARGIDPSDRRRFAAVEIPDSLHRLVLARLDQLDEGEQAAVKVASVIGRVFRARWLWGSYPEVGSPEEVARHLDHLDTLGLAPLRAAVPEAEYGFKHAIIQEVAYDSLAFGMRQTLHEAVGRFIEDAYADRLDEYVDVLAHHYGHTRNEDKQRRWFRAAADAAKAGYANEAAVEQYERLLPLLASEQTGDVLLELGAVWHLVGRWADAERAYRRAIEVAGRSGDRPLLAASTRDLGILIMRTRSYTEGVALLEEAAVELEALGELRGLAVALDRLAFAAIQQGAYADAAKAADHHLAIATQVDDPREVSGALHNLGLVAWDSGRRDQALELLRRALDAVAEAGDRRGEGRIASDLAAVYAEGGAHRAAVSYLGQALSIARQIGDRWVVALGIGNAAELYLLRGEYAQAARYSAQVLRVALELGDWAQIIMGVARFAAIATATGEPERAEQLFTRAEALARTVGDTFTLHGYLPQHAKLLADQGRLEEAERLTGEILEPAADTDSPRRLRAELLSLRLRVALGRLPAADAIQRLAAMAAAAEDAGDQAAISETIWRVDPSQEAARADAAARYRTLYEHAPTVEYRDAYAGLTGVELPPGEPLPSPSESVEDAPVDLDLAELLVKVDEAAKELPQPAAS
jgi:tetratricopeptide (TPR) repeat protein